MPTFPSSLPVRLNPTGAQVTETINNAPQLSRTSAPQQGPALLRNVEEMIASGKNKKSQLIHHYMELKLEAGATREDSIALQKCLRLMMSAISQGEPVDSKEFGKILREIDASEEKNIPAFLEKMRDEIYPDFAQKYGDALHACSSCAEPIKTRIEKSRKAIVEVKEKIYSAPASQIMGRANRAIYLTQWLQSQKVLDEGVNPIINTMQQRHAKMNEQTTQIQVMEWLATALLSLSQGRDCAVSFEKRLQEYDYGDNEKWLNLSPEKAQEVSAELAGKVRDGREKLSTAIVHFTSLLNRAQNLPMDRKLFDEPFGVYRYSSRVKDEICTAKSLIGMAGITLADSLSQMNTLLIGDYHFNFNRHQGRAFASEEAIAENRACHINGATFDAQMKALHKLQQPALTLCNILNATSSRVKENLPLLARVVPGYQHLEVQDELEELMDNLQYAASEQILHTTHQALQILWFAMRTMRVDDQTQPEIILCRKLIHDIRDVASAARMMTEVGSFNANVHAREVPDEINAAILHSLSAALSDFGPRIQKICFGIQKMQDARIQSGDLDWLKKSSIGALQSLHPLVNSTRSGLQMKIDQLPTDQQLPSSQSKLQFAAAKKFIKGHYIDKTQEKKLDEAKAKAEADRLTKEAARREKAEAELIAAFNNDKEKDKLRAKQEAGKNKKNSKTKNQGNAKPVDTQSSSSAQPAVAAMRADPVEQFQNAFERYQEEKIAIDLRLENELICLSEGETQNPAVSSTEVANAGEWAAAMMMEKFDMNRKVAQIAGSTTTNEQRAKIEKERSLLNVESKKLKKEIDQVTKRTTKISEKLLRQEAYTSLEFDKVVKLIELGQITLATNEIDRHNQIRRVKRDINGKPELNGQGGYVLEDRPPHMQGLVLGYTLNIANETVPHSSAQTDRKIVYHPHYDPITLCATASSLKTWEERNWSINPVNGKPVTRESLSTAQFHLLRNLLDVHAAKPFGWASVIPEQLTPAMIARIPQAR